MKVTRMALGPLFSKIGVPGTQALRCPAVDLTTGMGAYAVRTNGGQTRDSYPGGMERAGAMFRHVTQNGIQFKLYEFSTIFHLIFSDHN